MSPWDNLKSVLTDTGIRLGWSWAFSWTGDKEKKPMKNWKWFNETTDPKIVGVDPEIVSGLDSARQQTVDEDPEHKGVPIILTGALRPLESEMHLHGGVQDSSHLPHPPNGFCFGVDVSAQDNRQMGYILPALFAQGFRRVGLYFRENADGTLTWTHIHADKDPELMTKTGPVVWLKKELN